MTTSFPVATHYATHYAPLAARYQPAAANGRSKKMIALGRVLVDRGSVS